MKISHFYSLRIKLIAILSVIILGVGSGLGWYFIHQQIDVMFRSLLTTGDLLVRNLAHNSRYSLISENESLLTQLVEGTMQVEDVVYVVMTGPDGKTLVAKEKSHITGLPFRASSSTPLLDAQADLSQQIADRASGNTLVTGFNIGARPHALSPQTIEAILSTGLSLTAQGEVFDFAIPVWRHRSNEMMPAPFTLEAQEVLEPSEPALAQAPQIYGVVQVGMSSAPMQARLHDNIFNVVMFTSLIILVGIIATITLANRIIMPLQRLTQVAKRVMTGDLSALAHPKTQDEVGQLTTIFNQMTRSLADQQQRLENLIAHLPVGVFLINVEGNLILTNPVGHEQLQVLGQVEVGSKLEYLAEFSVKDLLSEITVDQSYKEIWVPGPPLQIFEVVGRIVRTGSEAGGGLIVVRNTTLQKVAEDALRESEQQLREVMEAREQLGRDLHDGILQSLYAVGLGIEVCKPLMKESHDEATQQLDQSIGQLNSVMKTIRNFISGVDAPVPEKIKLHEALHTLVHEMTSVHETSFTISCEKNVSQVATNLQSMHLLNIVREGISNCLRHANASQGQISLRMDHSKVRLDIIDNGVGFSNEHLSTSGHGLENIQIRAEQMGGHFRVTSKPGKGTHIIVTISREEIDGKAEDRKNSISAS